jgi:activator of HSP90 ATPase
MAKTPTHTIEQTVTFDATPAVVYRALVDPKQHSAMTGSRAENQGKVGGAFSAYDGYIVGFNVELDKGNRVVQAWRANDWDEGAWSIVRFELTPAGTGRTRLAFTQHGVPDAHHRSISQGWKDFYWKPLAAWLAARETKGRTTKKPARKK